MKKNNVAQSIEQIGNNTNVNAKNAKPKNVNAKQNTKSKPKTPKTSILRKAPSAIAKEFVAKIVLNDKWFATLSKYNPEWFMNMVIAIINNGFGTFDNWIDAVVFPIAKSIREIDTIETDKFVQNESGTAKTIMLNYAGRLLTTDKLKIMASVFNELSIDGLSIDNVPHVKTKTAKISESDKLAFIESQLTKSRFESYIVKIGKLTAADKTKSINRLYKSLID